MLSLKDVFSRKISVFALSWMAYALAYFGRMNLSVALPSIEKELAFSKVELGLLGGLFFWIYGVGQLISGRLGDHFHPRLFIFWGIFATGLINLVFGFMASLTFMLILWGLNGYFQSMLWGPLMKVLAGWFSEKRLATVAVIFSTSTVAGFLLAWGGAGRLTGLYGWRYAFIVPGVVILAFAVLWLIFFPGKNFPGGGGRHEGAVSGRREGVMRRVLLESRLGFIILTCMAQGIVKEGISLWGPTFILEQWGLAIEETSRLILLIPATSLIGFFLASRLNGLMSRGEGDPARGSRKVVLILFLFTGLCLLTLYFLGAASLPLALFLLASASACLYGANSMLLGVIPMSFNRMGTVSTVAGLLDFSTYMSAGLSVIVVGVVLRYFGWDAVILIWVAAATLGTLAVFFDLRRR